MLSGKFDHIFQIKLDSWTQFRHRTHQLFSQREMDSILRCEKTFDGPSRTTVFLSFENRLVSLGGLAAVTRLLPSQLQKMDETVIVMTPFHHGCSKVTNALTSGVLVEVFAPVTFHLCNYEGIITCYKDTGSDIPSYHLKIDGRFTAGENPYDYEQPGELLLDSLAFSAAVPFVLSKLGIRNNVLLHANDWETVPVAVTSKFALISNLLDSARTVLTLHNCFDVGISRELKLQFFGIDIPGHTVLQCFLPWLNGPLTTVSTPFAHELRRDPLQRGIFTDHLQNELAMNPPLGIENGMFGKEKCPYSATMLKKAQKGEVEPLLIKKRTYRKQFLELIDISTDQRIIGTLSVNEITDDIPVYFMAGRLDVMQKGFDVVFHAFERLKRGSAKLFFCPSSSNGSLDFFIDCAKRCDGDITIWPFRILQEQFDQCIRGASFLVMPSLYEPFGAATEGYIQGTPVVARGTGGLWTQVISWNTCNIPQFYQSLIQANTVQSKPTGILFHEDFPEEEAEKLWRNLLESSLEERINSPLYVSIVNAAKDAFRNAEDLFQQPEVYAQIILNGFEMLKSFSWEFAVKKYRKVYEVASTRGV